MSVNELSILVIAFASLIVSILSLVYAQKAYRFETAKFQSEQQSSDVFLNLSETIKYECGNYTILETKLQIQNNSSILRHAVNFNVVLQFGLYWKFPMPNPKPQMTITAGIYDKTARLSGLKELFDVLDKQESTRMVIIDAETHERVTFSPDKMKRIEPAPLSYSWIGYAIVPNSVINSLSIQNAGLNSIKLQLMLHPEEWKSQSSRRFWMSFGTPSQEVLSCIFPDQKAG